MIPAVVLIGGAAVAVTLAMAWSRARGGGTAAGGAGEPDAAMAARIDRELAREEL